MRYHAPKLSLGPWPALEWSQWKDTAETLHMWMQIVGKTRLELTSTQNHWWNVPLYVTSRGLWTSPMPIDAGHLLEIEFDFLAHELLFRVSTGITRTIKLEPRTVAAFYAEYQQLLNDLHVDVAIDPLPVEISGPIPFDQDTVHRSYDADAAQRFWHVLRLADTLFKRASTNFYGKISPVHFFWGSFDLAVTRFNGRRAPARDGADAIQSEAYSHEVISSGFWPGNGGYGRAAFYTYAAPVPTGLSNTILKTAGRFDPGLGEFLLDYEEVLNSQDPAHTVLSFLQETYSAAANAAGWDRSSLDRDDEVARAIALG
ncbi:DUF5996 family protein [Acidisarcina polymorpha]|uniref:DUF5996 family protein n=1 Tax=Acidisarcina polymorpha TaxID=2211140 RepID=UPI001F1D4C1D|nr:DUF5996 family protein [Acidisarcina polymorpha]